MAAIPEPKDTTVAAIYAAVAKSEAEERRAHLGASQLGKECRRALWYGFRWCDEPETDGRVLRLFRRGKLEEAQLTADLRAAGVEVHTHDEHGQQFQFSDVGGHVGGSMDGAGQGFIEAPKAWHVIEFKTHGAKSFATLTKKGAREAKPEHWAQMQLYMHWSGMDRAAYLAVCKDTDDLYFERIHYDREAAERLIAKARAIIEAPEPLERLSEDTTYYQCRFCNARRVCHEKRLPGPSCRTCVHSTPELDGAGRWSCAYHMKDLSAFEQGAGCDDHVYIPALVPLDFKGGDADGNWAEYHLPDGTQVHNGTPKHGSYSSAELYAAQDSGFKALTLEFVQYLRAQMGGTLEASSSDDPDDWESLKAALPLPGERAA